MLWWLDSASANFSVQQVRFVTVLDWTTVADIYVEVLDVGLRDGWSGRGFESWLGPRRSGAERLQRTIHPCSGRIFLNVEFCCCCRLTQKVQFFKCLVWQCQAVRAVLLIGWLYLISWNSASKLLLFQRAIALFLFSSASKRVILFSKWDQNRPTSEY